MLDGDAFVQEDRGRLSELLGGFRSEESAGGAFGEAAFEVGVALQIVGKRGRYDVALRDKGRRVWGLRVRRERGGGASIKESLNLFLQKWVVRTAENDGIDKRVFIKELRHIFLNEIVGSGIRMFSRFDKRHPHWARFLQDDERWVDFLQFEDVRLG